MPSILFSLPIRSSLSNTVYRDWISWDYAAIGQYTLQNTFHLDFVTVELDLSVRIKPSTNEDSIIEVPNTNAGISESIEVRFGVEDLNVDLALLMAIDDDRLKALEIGGILRSENLLSCFVSVIHELAVAGFDVSVGSIRDPVLSGFVSRGIDRVVSQAVESVFLMYEPTFLKALPSMFQGPFRDIIQEEILASNIFSPTQGACTWLQAESSLDDYVDFRDLFLPPGESLLLGGSGEEPYGNIGKFWLGQQIERFGTLSLIFLDKATWFIICFRKES